MSGHIRRLLTRLLGIKSPSADALHGDSDLATFRRAFDDGFRRMTEAKRAAEGRNDE